MLKLSRSALCRCPLAAASKMRALYYGQRIQNINRCKHLSTASSSVPALFSNSLDLKSFEARVSRYSAKESLANGEKVLQLYENYDPLHSSENDFQRLCRNLTLAKDGKMVSSVVTLDF